MIAGADDAASGLLHVGFARPDTTSVQVLLTDLAAGLYVTESARHAVPRECSVSGDKAGYCEGRDLESQAVYRCFGLWLGVKVGDEAGTQHSTTSLCTSDNFGTEASKPHGDPAVWIARLREEDQDAATALEREGVWSDEDFLRTRVRLPDSVRLRADQCRFRALTEGVPLGDPFVVAPLLPDWVKSAPLSALGLSRRCINVFIIARLKTVADVLELGPHGIMELRNFGRTSLQDFGERLYHFAAESDPPLGLLRAALHDADTTQWSGAPRSLRVLVDTETHPSPVPRSEPPTLSAALRAALDSITERDAEVLRHWLGMGGQPTTLEEIGNVLGVTRERARQIRNRAWERVRNEWRWPGEVVHRLEGLLNGRTEPLYLDLIAADDTWFDGFQDRLVVLGRLIEELTGDAIHVWPLDGRLIATRCPAERWPAIVEAARTAAEREIPSGITRSDAQLLIGAVAVAEGSPDLAKSLWERLMPELHFASWPGGEERLITVGRGLRHPLAAILEEADRPLHVTEIVDRLHERGHLGRKDYSAQNMARAAVREAGGVLYGRSVYGLAKHLPVGPEAAEEALSEIEALILGGAEGRQWHCSELADELAVRRPDLEDELDQFAVNAILSRSSDLTYLGRLVWVGARREGGLQDRLDVAGLCEAALVKAGRPLSKRELRDAISQVRGLNQHFLPQASERVVRLAHGMWGLADRDVGVSAANQKAALDALFQALEARQKGLHVSELFDALHAIGFTPDTELAEWELLGIAQSDPRFRVGRGQLVGLADWADVRRRSIGQALAELQSRWQGPVTGDVLHAAACALTERQLSRTYLASHAARSGFVYDATMGLWDVIADATDALEIGGEDDL